MAGGTRTLVILTLLLASVSCGERTTDVATNDARGSDATHDAGRPRPSTPPPAQATDPATDPPTVDPGPRREDVELARRFVGFALDLTPASAAAIGFAPDLRLGLSRDLLRTADAAAVLQPATWGLEPPKGHLRGHVGTFSALELVADHALRTGSMPAGVGDDRGPWTVSVGDHAHCASPPTPAPDGLARHHRVSLQPSGTSIDGCLSWFTVDLFLDDARRVSAVTLDIWEP